MGHASSKLTEHGRFLANDVVAMACDRFGRPRPAIVPESQDDGSGDEHGAVYLPYFDMDVVFDDSHARSVLGPVGIDSPQWADYFDTLMDYAEAVRWGKRTMTREEARERLTGTPASASG